MTRENFENQIKKPAALFQVGGFRPLDSLTASWVGNVTVRSPGENWPESNGKPMIPICQINLDALPQRPERLNDIALLALFVDADEIPDGTPNGAGWLLRTYADLGELVALKKPDVEFTIKPFQLKPELIENDFPSWEDCPIEVPDEFDDEYSDLFPTREGIKLGGWPYLVQSELFWAPFNQHPAEPEYIFQVDSVEKAHWAWGHNGLAYIGRGTKPGFEDVWTFCWQCY